MNSDIASMREALHAVSDSDLAGMLGLGRSAVSQWRKRGAIPESAKAKAAHVENHLRQFADAAGQVASIEPITLTHARGLAIAFAYRHASGQSGRFEDRLLEIAGALDHVTVAAAKALRRWMRDIGAHDIGTAYETLLIDGNLERALMNELLPPHLPQSLPQ